MLGNNNAKQYLIAIDKTAKGDKNPQGETDMSSTITPIRMPETTLIINATFCREAEIRARVRDAMNAARNPDFPLVEVHLPEHCRLDWSVAVNEWCREFEDWWFSKVNKPIPKLLVWLH
ncbi:MAG: hypothetical protein HYV68_01740 [Candidatus Taylorbacteria bacterium]|nr:hypothetical protein [Candidatus Taylorbacteria bacterium]